MEISNNTNNSKNEEVSLLDQMAKVSSEEILLAANKKVEEIINESKEIVFEYLSYSTEENNLSELEISLIRNIALFSIKEVEKGLLSDTSKIDNPFMKNILYFWTEVINQLKQWTPTTKP